ncbi:hypothetical protein [Mycobacterium sp.]|uniref:hypothetical protein n=1 Tax=Mycobacterium sp. TaxID=1785 RepID=UPI003C736762
MALPDRILVFSGIHPAIVTVRPGLDGSGPVAHDDRMVALDEPAMTAPQVDQLLITPDQAGDHRPGDGESRFAADMMPPMTQAKLTP